ncbi:PaaI family thioesterase [Blastopirellula marina]|uniref:Thioesterase domain-containing protein n=1 Tax=Blastopirellula marina DSM 3645 TaxID=314230 RepID=A3ZX87_9BACT|nr:PaaI family thioesterase [Blastopirellula marina]EAQ78972.1 hypothetical protein DSM3645_27868 [Blastopirellula marina DSM 3645]
MARQISTFEYLQMLVSGASLADVTTNLIYPPAIWTTLGLRLVEIDLAYAKLELDTDLRRHGNQLGITHGGVACEMADAAIGTAHSTVIGEDESLASVELKVNFFRPVGETRLTATARRVNAGRTLSYYVCEVHNEAGKLVASVNSTVMTLKGEQATRG